MPEFIWYGLRDDIEGGLERLARLSYDAEVVLGQLEHRLSGWLPNALDGKPERCKLLRPFFSNKIQPVSLAKAGVAVFNTLLTFKEKEEEKAALLHSLSIYLGNRQAVLNAIFEAVELYERFAASNPEVFEPNLGCESGSVGKCLCKTRSI